MKNSCFLLFFWLIVFNQISAQSFNLTDTVFKINDIFNPNYPILYEIGKKEISPVSFPVLDNFADFMRKNPKLIIEVGYHTDSRCSKIYSSKLDLVRAKSVVDYLINKGISKERLIPVGYGSEKPLVPDSLINQLEAEQEKEAAHARNRRTEFKIISIDYSE